MLPSSVKHHILQISLTEGLNFRSDSKTFSFSFIKTSVFFFLVVESSQQSNVFRLQTLRSDNDAAHLRECLPQFSVIDRESFFSVWFLNDGTRTVHLWNDLLWKPTTFCSGLFFLYFLQRLLSAHLF